MDQAQEGNTKRTRSTAVIQNDVCDFETITYERPVSYAASLLKKDCEGTDEFSDCQTFVPSELIEKGYLNDEGLALYQKFLDIIKSGTDIVYLVDAKKDRITSGYGEGKDNRGKLIKCLNCWDNRVVQGIVYGHPKLPDGEDDVQTSSIVFEKDDFTWCYTKRGSVYRVYLRPGQEQSAEAKKTESVDEEQVKKKRKQDTDQAIVDETKELFDKYVREVGDVKEDDYKAVFISRVISVYELYRKLAGSSIPDMAKHVQSRISELENDAAKKMANCLFKCLLNKVE
jgi:hypothetical protein